MSILEAVVLFAAADEEDPQHHKALGYLESLGHADFYVASFALLEFDIVLKSRAYTFDERMEKHALLLRDFPLVEEKSSKLRPSTFYLAAKIEKEVGLEYFDAGVAAESLQHDGTVISTDAAFEKVASLRRAW